MSCFHARAVVLAALAATIAAPRAAQSGAPIGTPVQGKPDSYGAASYAVPPGWSRISNPSKDLGVQLGAKWTDRLCLVEGSGEVCYNRSR
jgi:hypothetical protein